MAPKYIRYKAKVESEAYHGAGDNLSSDQLMYNKMICLLMRDGKRGRAERLFAKTLEELESDSNICGRRLFNLAVCRAMRDIGVREKAKPKKRSSSFSSYVPYRVSPFQGMVMAMRDLIKASKSGPSTKPFWENLSQEIFKAARGDGEIVPIRFNYNDLAVRNQRSYHYGRQRA